MKSVAKIIFNIAGCFLVLDLTYSMKLKKWTQWEDNNEISRAAVYNIQKLWTNGIVYYKIDENLNGNITSLLKQAMKLFENNTCIKFIQWQNQSTDYVFIQQSNKCSSVLGRQRGKQNLFLSNHYCSTIGQILHELMHTLGFWHEMNRNDRDDYVEIHWNKIKDGEEFNFNKLRPWEYNSLNTSFDYDSVMMYGSMAFSVDNSPTITPKKSGVILRDVSEKTNLSEIDIKRINRLYECFNENRPSVPDPPEYFCDLENGDCSISVQTGNNVAQWVKVRGPMGTLQGDHTTGSGFYWAVDAKTAGGKQAIMYLPQFNRRDRSVGCLSFYYHVRGPGTRKFMGILQTVSSNFEMFSFSNIETPINMWRKLAIEINLNINNFIIVLLAVSTPTDLPGGIFAVDDIRFQWTHCKL